MQTPYLLCLQMVTLRSTGLDYTLPPSIFCVLTLSLTFCPLTNPVTPYSQAEPIFKITSVKERSFCTVKVWEGKWVMENLVNLASVIGLPIWSKLISGCWWLRINSPLPLQIRRHWADALIFRRKLWENMCGRVCSIFPTALRIVKAFPELVSNKNKLHSELVFRPMDNLSSLNMFLRWWN